MVGDGVEAPLHLLDQRLVVEGEAEEVAARQLAIWQDTKKPRPRFLPGAGRAVR